MTKRFRSANIHEGMLRAPTRAFLHALGQDDDEIARPHIGVFHTGGEMSPCNMLLRDQALHAERIGMQEIKTELEDLAFKHLEPEAYKTLARLVAAKRGEREQLIAQMREPLEKRLTDAGMSTATAGLFAATVWVGILCMAPMASALTQRIGRRRFIACCTAPTRRPGSGPCSRPPARTRRPVAR